MASNWPDEHAEDMVSLCFLDLYTFIKIIVHHLERLDTNRQCQL